MQESHVLDSSSFLRCISARRRSKTSSAWADGGATAPTLTETANAAARAMLPALGRMPSSWSLVPCAYRNPDMLCWVTWTAKGEAGSVAAMPAGFCA